MEELAKSTGMASAILEWADRAIQYIDDGFATVPDHLVYSMPVGLSECDQCRAVDWINWWVVRPANRGGLAIDFDRSSCYHVNQALILAEQFLEAVCGGHTVSHDQWLGTVPLKSS